MVQLKRRTGALALGLVVQVICEAPLCRFKLKYPTTKFWEQLKINALSGGAVSQSRGPAPCCQFADPAVIISAPRRFHL